MVHGHFNLNEEVPQKSRITQKNNLNDNANDNANLDVDENFA